MRVAASLVLVVDKAIRIGLVVLISVAEEERIIRVCTRGVVWSQLLLDFLGDMHLGAGRGVAAQKSQVRGVSLGCGQEGETGWEARSYLDAPHADKKTAPRRSAETRLIMANVDGAQAAA